MFRSHWRKSILAGQLKGIDFIILKSTRTQKEKWGRYLGDIFIPKAPLPSGRGQAAEGEPRQGRGEGAVYLNQLLLDAGHAVRLR